MNEKWKSVLGIPSRSSNKKIANGLVALSSAAVMAVYAAGYSRTKAAADGLDAQAERREAAQGRGPQAAAPRALAAQPVEASAETPTGLKVVASAAPARTESTSAPSTSAPPVAIPQAPATATTPVMEAKLEKPEIPAPTAPTPTPAVAAAPAPAPAPAPEPPPAPKWKDGTYTGWGTSRHGDIQAEVIIEGGKIKSATIAECRTRYSCSVIAPLPPEVAQRQSPEIDYVSGATQSTNAFYYGVIEALGKAK